MSVSLVTNKSWVASQEELACSGTDYCSLKCAKDTASVSLVTNKSWAASQEELACSGTNIVH